MNTKWTPGPWSVSDGGVWAKSPWNATVRIAQMSNISKMNGIDQEANAHLIAAAPELYEALDALLKCWDETCSLNRWFPDFDPSAKNARAALAKARGE